MQNLLQSLRYLKDNVVYLESNQRPSDPVPPSSGCCSPQKASDSVNEIQREVERLYMLIIDLQTRLINQDDYR